MDGTSVIPSSTAQFMLEKISEAFSIRTLADTVELVESLSRFVQTASANNWASSDVKRTSVSSDRRDRSRMVAEVALFNVNVCFTMRLVSLMFISMDRMRSSSGKSSHEIPIFSQFKSQLSSIPSPSSSLSKESGIPSPSVSIPDSPTPILCIEVPYFTM